MDDDDELGLQQRLYMLCFYDATRLWIILERSLRSATKAPNINDRNNVRDGSMILWHTPIWLCRTAWNMAKRRSIFRALS